MKIWSGRNSETAFYLIICLWRERGIYQPFPLPNLSYSSFLLGPIARPLSPSAQRNKLWQFWQQRRAIPWLNRHGPVVYTAKLCVELRQELPAQRIMPMHGKNCRPTLPSVSQLPFRVDSLQYRWQSLPAWESIICCRWNMIVLEFRTLSRTVIYGMA